MDHYLNRWIRMFTVKRRRKVSDGRDTVYEPGHVLIVLCLSQKSRGPRRNMSLPVFFCCTFILLVAETRGKFSFRYNHNQLVELFNPISVQLSVSAEWKRTKKQLEQLSPPWRTSKDLCLSRARPSLEIVPLCANRQLLVLLLLLVSSF